MKISNSIRYFILKSLKSSENAFSATFRKSKWVEVWLILKFAIQNTENFTFCNRKFLRLFSFLISHSIYLTLQTSGSRNRVTGFICAALFTEQNTTQFSMASFPTIQVTEGEWTSPKQWKVLGVKIPHFFSKDPAKLADYIAKFETRPEDVFVVTYPKSGWFLFWCHYFVNQ